MEQIAETLKKIRNSSGLTQSEFAARLGVKQSFLSAMERGKRKVSMKVANKLIEEFQVSAKSLFHNESNNADSNNVPPKRTAPRTPPSKKTLSSTTQKGESTTNQAVPIGEERQNNLLKADGIRNKVEAAAVGGDAARRWADRRFMESKLYKRHPSAESATLYDYMLTSQLGQYVDRVLVELHNRMHKKIDQVLDRAIDSELTMPQAAAEIQEITAPLTALQAHLESYETAMFSMVRATVEQFPEMLESVKGTSLFHGMREWLEDAEKGSETAVEAVSEPKK